MFITSAGMVCPVGLNAAATCAAIRAGIASFEELPYLDSQGEPIIGARIPNMETDLKFENRIIELLAVALSDCLKEKLSVAPERIPLLVGLPESERPGLNNAFANRIIALVQEKLQIQFHPELSRTNLGGHTAGFEALRMARDLFKAPMVSACLICGVDSYINARSLLWLDEHSRLKTVQNSDGVIPGEAAAVVLLERQGAAKINANIMITGLGFGKEKASVLSDEPLLGMGLTKAAGEALAEAGIQMHEIDFRLSDVTGESYGYKEQALVEGRLLRIRKDELPTWHSADCIGDTGAAAGTCQLVIAYHAVRKGYAPGDRAICYSSAVHGERASVVLQRQ